MAKLLLSTSLAALALATSAAAQTAASDQAVDQARANTNEVVVTATRLPTEKLKVADSVTVITAQDIALKAQQTVPQILADAPGLNTVQTGGPGGTTSVLMRGTNANHVKVFADGIDVGDPSSPSGAVDFSQFLTADIDRVEILRGPQSGLYGSDAIGGVINIITKTGNGPPHASLDLSGGSFDTFNQSANVSGSTGAFHYAATVAHFYSGSTPVTPLNLLAPGEKRNNDSYDNISASTKLGYDVTSNFDVGLVARYTKTHLKFTGDGDFCPPADFFGYCLVDDPDPVQSTADYEQYHLRATGHLTLFDGRFDQTLGVAYSNLKSTDVTPFGDSFTSPYDAALGYGTSVFAGDRVKVDWQGHVKLADTETLVIGAEHQYDAITRPISTGINNEAGFAELQSSLFPNFNDTIAVRYDANSRFGGQFTYRFAPTYFIAATGSKLEASVGTGFKAPTLSQLYEDFPAYGFYANPNLQPEKSIGYDVGFEQYLLDKKLQFGATYFYNHITNLISTLFIGGGVGPCPVTATFGCSQYGNIGKTHADGVEAFVLVQPIETLSFRVDYTYTDAMDDILHQELVRRPRNKWNVDARWQATKQLSLDLDVLNVDSWIDANRSYSITRLKAPGYTTADVTANYDVTDHVTVYLNVTNLFDERYQEPDDFLRPGRGFLVGIRAKL